MTMPVEVLRRLEEAAAQLEAEIAEQGEDRPRAEASPLLKLVRGLSAQITRLLGGGRRQDGANEQSAHEQDL